MLSLSETCNREKQDYDAAARKMKKLILDGLDSGFSEQSWEEHKRELIAKIDRHALPRNTASKN